MPHSITFNGVNSLECGLLVSGAGTYNAPSKDYEKVNIPGRNGDLLFYNKRFNNIEVTYPGIIINNYSENTEKVRNWLLSTTGYCRLEDTYHPEEFRMAMFEGPVDFETTLLSAGEADFTFNCKPERWLKSGECSIVFTPSMATKLLKISNPTPFNAKPVIRVYGSGEVGIGTGLFTVNPATGTNYIDIDCDIMDCFEGASNRNSEVTITKWPELVPGLNTITFSEDSGITKIEVTPRWWII